MINNWLRYSGLAVPPLAWAGGTQLGQVMPYVDCQQHVSWTSALCGLLLFVSIAGIAASRLFTAEPTGTGRFVVKTGFMIAWTFVVALTLQGVSPMLLDPCQR
jgi:hypothetical protein